MRVALVVPVALGLAACAGSSDLPFPEGAHRVEDAALSEMSGLVASRRDPGVLWGINDSGSLPRLYRLGERGEALGRVFVTGAWLHDTETLARWRGDGGDWLLVGDIGDNKARRDHVVVHAVAEPAPDAERAAIAWSLRFRYPDGARDAEAMAVDAQRDELLVLTKREEPPRLYRVPLTTRAGESIATAEYLGSPPPGVIRGAVTGLDLGDDGTELVVLTYHGLYVWHRAAGEPWATVLARAPVAVERPAMAKAEAMALTAGGGRIVVGSEKRPTPLWSGDTPSPR
jgi:hypothetical protein